MKKRDEFQIRLAALNNLDDPAGEEATTLLRQALRGRSNLLAARAAEIVGAWQLVSLHADLLAAFDHFVVDPLKRDLTCAAKFAIANTLVQLDKGDDELFLTGIRLVQMEPVFKGYEDTAAKVRAVCAVGLARMHYPGVLLELAELLNDPEPDARIGAIQAISQVTELGGLPLLWFKLLIGDEELEVVYECFTAVLDLAPERAVDKVAGYLLDDNVATAESAALALGESRQPAAFAALRGGWQQSQEPAVRRTILLALAMLRQEEATEFLLQVLKEGSVHEAHSALAALEVFRDDTRLWRRVEKRIARRKDL